MARSITLSTVLLQSVLVLEKFGAAREAKHVDQLEQLADRAYVGDRHLTSGEHMQFRKHFDALKVLSILPRSSFKDAPFVGALVKFLDELAGRAMAVSIMNLPMPRMRGGKVAPQSRHAMRLRSAAAL